MDENDTDPDGIQEGDILQKELHLIGGLHRAAAVLDEEDPPAELLEVGKRLKEGLRALAGCDLGSHSNF